MNARVSRSTGGLLATLLVITLIAPAHAGDPPFSLAGAVPNDVFIFTAERHNPEREFLHEYWGSVFDALCQTGIGDDVMGLLGTLLGADQMAEVERLKSRATELFDGVDWDQLGGGEVAFAERLKAPSIGLGQGPVVIMPEIVVLLRGSGDGAAKNFDGLVAILEAIGEEINKVSGSEALTVKTSAQMGAQVASLNVLAMAPGAPPMSLAVSLRDDLVAITLGDEIRTDVLGLLAGSSSKTAMADDPRFKAAFAQLPAAEDTLEFFDLQSLLQTIRGYVELGIAASTAPGDIAKNTGVSAKANELSKQALKAYRSGDYPRALALIKEAHEVAPGDSVVLYNVACFSALVGEKAEALTWLEKAVEAGFHSPHKISSDSDLVSIQGDPRFEAAVAKAGEQAAQRTAEDVVLNSVKSGEAHELCMQAWEVYKDQEYQQGLELVQQAYDLAPQDSRVQYYLACFHALLGHEDQAHDFLQRAVDGGFYSPGHISRDPDLESLRDDERYAAALTKAQQEAGKIGAKEAAKRLKLVQGLVVRLADAVGILDYSAAVESTDGYSVHTESIAVLVPDAQDRAIYPVFAKRGQITDGTRYLPEETVSFSVCGGFDLGELYTFLEDTLRAGGPAGEELLAKWSELQAQIGLDVRRDVLDWIAGDMITVTLEDGLGSVWMIKVTDEQTAREKVAAAVEFLSVKLTEMAAQNPMLAMMAIRTSPTLHEQLDGFQNLHFIMSPKPVVWGIADGQLILSTSVEAVALCLSTAQGKHPDIRENERVMAEALMPDGPFTSVSLTDQRRMGEEMAELIGVLSMASGMMIMLIPDPEIRPIISKVAGMLAKLTPVVRKIDFYKSTAEQTSFDGRVWRSHKVTHYVAPEERHKSRPQGAETLTPAQSE